MLFEELVEQHRVHCFVAHRERLALVVRDHKIRIHLCDFLRHQPELRRCFRVKLFLVAESDRFQRKDGFARLVHRLDCLFVANRRGLDTKLTTGVYPNRRSSGDRHSTNTGHEGRGLGSDRADADGVGLAANAFIADVDIVIAGAEIDAGVSAQCDVVAAGGVVKERFQTGGGIVIAGCVLNERANTGGRVAAASCVQQESSKTGGRVVGAGVVKKRISTGGRVEISIVIAAKERLLTGGRVESPVVLLRSACKPVAVLLEPVVFSPSASTPVAVLLLPVVLFTSAPSPKNVLALLGSQPRWQTARAVGEAAAKRNVRTMENNWIVVFMA